MVRIKESEFEFGASHFFSFPYRFVPTQSILSWNETFRFSELLFRT